MRIFVLGWCEVKAPGVRLSGPYISQEARGERKRVGGGEKMQGFKHLRILADLSKLNKVGDETTDVGPEDGIVYCGTNYTSCCTYNSCNTNYGACYSIVDCETYIYC